MRSATSARATTEQVAGATTASAQDAHETSRAADEARAAAGVGTETVARATEAMAAVRDASAEASLAIRELGSQSQCIGGIVEPSRTSPSRPTCWRSTPPSRPRAPASTAAASPSWPRRSASWPRQSQAAAKSIPNLVSEIRTETQRTVVVCSESCAERGELGASTGLWRRRDGFTRIAASIEVVSERVSQVSAVV